MVPLSQELAYAHNIQFSDEVTTKRKRNVNTLQNQSIHHHIPTMKRSVDHFVSRNTFLNNDHFPDSRKLHMIRKEIEDKIGYFPAAKQM